MALGQFSQEILKDQGHAFPASPEQPKSGTDAAPSAEPVVSSGDIAPANIDTGAPPAPTDGDAANPPEFVETRVIDQVAAPEPGVVVVNDTSTTAGDVPDQQAVPAVLSDEELLRIVSERTGRQLTSLDELNQPEPSRELTEEERRQEEERIRNEAIAYGISNKLFTRKDLEAYLTDKSKSPRDVAFAVFAQQMREVAPGVTDEELSDQFATWAHEHEEEGHPLRKIKEAEMQRMHSSYLNENYGTILQIDQRYVQDQQVLSEGQQYGQTISRLFGDLTDGTKPYEMTFSVGTLGDYKYEVSAETLNTIKDQYLNADTFRALGEKAKDSKLLSEMIKNAIIAKDVNKIIHRVAEAHKAKALLAVAAERHGVLPQRPIESQQNNSPQSGLGKFSQAVLDEAKRN